ncbi:ATP-binding protein [Streptomyces stramineus]|uniref:Histidine kinase/HSP90-like ATPase domain-containing protein n=1 Tax=Streptomyces stramineus TaxID=173861 RepID=A0ABN1AMR1_9ACTN
MSVATAPQTSTVQASQAVPALRKRPRLQAEHLQAMGVPRQREAVSEARRTVRRLLLRWGVSAEQAFEAELFAAELLTNAYRHSRADTPGTEIGLCIAEGGGAILIEVEDPGGEGRPAARRQTDEGAERGRGLDLVENLGRWGYRTLPDGHLSTWAYVRPAAQGHTR